MAEETKKFCKILLLRPCGLSGYIARVAEDPYPNLWELKSHGYIYKTTPKCAPEVFVEIGTCADLSFRQDISDTELVFLTEEAD